jgi:FkbM family methyltransferase
MTKKIIYDLGANVGDNIPYYLKKGDLIVAVEANPILADEIKLRFNKEIQDGRLVVEAFVLTTSRSGANVPFYIHNEGHVLSQFPKPDDKDISKFTQIFLPSINIVDLIKKHGEPFYIKVDIEHYDAIILSEIFRNNIRPSFISAESHSIDVFCTLVSEGHYQAFNLVDGFTMHHHYANADINDGNEKFNFPKYSSGPFGEDLKDNWMTADNFYLYLANEGLGWKDIHATNLIKADPQIKIKPMTYARKMVLKKITPKLLRPFFNLN